MVTYPSLCGTCMTYKAPYDSNCRKMLPTQPLLRGVEDFRRGDKHLRDVPLLTYLAWLQPDTNNLRLINKHVKIKNVLLVVKTFIKNHNVVITSTNNHFNQLSIVLAVLTSLASYLKYLLKIAPLKNTFKNCSLKSPFQNCSLKKYISKSNQNNFWQQIIAVV